MFAWTALPARLLCAALVALVAGGGCANWRVPAIDQTGDRVFAPAPASTSFVNPFSECRLFNCARPAFETPPTPPPCDFAYVEPADPCDVLLGAPVPCPDPCAIGVPAPAPVVAVPAPVGPGLVITPARLVSPVGSEVVLSAGVANPQGAFQKEERIEWMLSQDSVGNFVDLGKDDDCFLASWLHHTKPEKLSANYAVGFASKAARKLTRGTPTPADDVTVPAGHSWLSLTSATEGTSHVTAFAPGATQWDRRQQTATIYWIDAQWAFPPPAIARSGEKQVLTTTVTRASNGSPLVGWVVRYEVVGGPTAGFGAQGDRVIEAATNHNGQATVEIAPLGRESGQTQIAIQVIRPAGSDGLPRLAVGQGGTGVSWSAPGLAVRLVGPEQAAAGAPATYRIEVTNPGDLPARGVTVSDALPAGLVHQASSPAAQVLGDRLTWQLGDIPAHSTQVIELTCQVQATGDLRQCATARSADGLTAENCLVTRIIQRSLAVKMTGPPGNAARVGEQVQYVVELTNVSGQPLRNLTLRLQFDPGLRHAEAASPIVKTYDQALNPNDTARIPLNFTVVAPGQHSLLLEISAPGEQTIQARATLTAAAVAPQPTPQLRITHAGPPRAAAGQSVDFVVNVTNVGDATLTRVRVVDTYSASLVPTDASEGRQQVGASLHWFYDQLAPGQSIQVAVRCRCAAADPRACNKITVSSDQTQPQSEEACLVIDPGAAPPPATPGVNPGAAAPAAGKLTLALVSNSGSIATGGTVRFYITVKNDRNVGDKNVQLQIRLPAGLTYSRFFTPLAGGISAASQDGKTLDVTRIAEIRPGEEIAFTLELTASRAGEQTVQVWANSQLQPQAISAQAKTTVFEEGGMR